MAIFDELKRLGVPMTAAAVVSALVVAIPFFFQLDSRYAKETALKEHVARLEARNEALARELAQNAGFQQAMIALLSNKVAAGLEPGAAPIPVPVPLAAPSPRAMASPPPPPPLAHGRGAPAAEVITAPARPASAPPMEQPKTWKELNEGLTRQQQRLYPPSTSSVN